MQIRNSVFLKKKPPLKHDFFFAAYFHIRFASI